MKFINIWLPVRTFMLINCMTHLKYSKQEDIIPNLSYCCILNVSIPFGKT